MPEVNMIKALLEQASTKGTKSTVLKPLGWMMLITVGSTLSSFFYKTPEWISYIFFGFTVFTMSLYLIAYIYCLIKDRDSLRSETYSIQKLAIEKGFIGDNLSGILARKDIHDLMAIKPASSEGIEEGNNG